MRASLLRISAAVLTIGLSAYAVFRSVLVLMFLATASQVEGAPGDSAARLRPWFDTPGVGERARDLATRGQFDLVLLRDLYTGIVMHSPFSPSSWVALAALDSLAPDTRSQAVQDLTMATILAPNEFQIMALRGKVGASLWEYLPPERRMSVAKDIVIGGREGVFNENLMEMRAVIRSKTPEAREEMRGVLMQIEGVTPGLLTYLGFPAQPTAQ